MADDITLTVRVRDLTRGDFARLQGNLNRMRQNLQGVNRATASAGRNSRLLGRDLRQLNTHLRRMQTTGRATARELTDMSNALTAASRSARNAARSGEITRNSYRAMTRDIRTMRAELVILGRQGTVFDRLGARMTLLQNRMRQTSGSSTGLRRTLSRMGEGMVGGLRSGVLATGLLLGAMRKLGSAINMNKRWTLILVAALLLIGPAAQALGALLVVALGGAFIALGALALKNSETVKSAFRDMKDSVSTSVREAAQPMEQDLASGIRQVGLAVQEMQPILSAVFGATGPLIENFFGAFTDLAGMSLPGIFTAMKEMGPVIEGFRIAMGMLGQGFGDMFAAMTAGGGAEALKQVWVTLGFELSNLLVGIGEFINSVSQSDGATLILVGALRTLSGILNVVEVGLSLVDSTFGGLLKSVVDTATGFSSLGDMGSSITDSFAHSGKSVGELKKELAAVNKEIADIKKDTEGEWYEFGLDDVGEQDRRGLDQLQRESASLTTALAMAQSQAAASTHEHAGAVSSLIQHMKELNAQNRSNLDAQSAMEKAIDDAVKNAEKLGKSDFKNGMFNMDTEKGREAFDLVSKISSTTSDYIAKLEEAEKPQSVINEAWARGREQLVGLHDELGLTRDQMAGVADEILGMPASLQIQVENQQAIADLQAVKDKLAESKSKTITVDALTATAREQLELLGFKITNTKGKSVTISVPTGSQRQNVDALAAAIAALSSKSVTIEVIRRTIWDNVVEGGGSNQAAKNAVETSANGNLFVQRFARGGLSENHVAQIARPGAMRIWAEPETQGEAYIPFAPAKRPRSRRIAEETVDRLGGAVQWFAKGGVTKAEKSARADARGDLTISHWGRKSGSKNTEFANDMGLADSLKELVGTLNKWHGVIKKATHGGVERRLLASLDKAGKSLLKYQGQHDKISKTLEKARAVRDSVKSGVLSATNITEGTSGDTALTTGKLMSRMTQNRDKATSFANALRDLRKKGVSKDIIKQIADAGIDGGGLETASALLRASGSEISSINSMQSQINSAALKAGNATADAMYGAGMKAGEGLIAGLEKQQKNIEKAMMKIAKSMEKAIKRALGIKSPSKVMQQVGHFTAEGFATGIEKNPNVGSAWSSMLNVPSGGGSSSGGSGSGDVYQINLVVGGKVMEEVWIDTGRRAVRTRGGRVESLLNTRQPKK